MLTSPAPTSLALFYFWVPVHPLSLASAVHSTIISYKILPVSQGSVHTRPLWCLCCCYLVAKSCLTLCDPADCSSWGSSVHGISQARTLEWVAISSSSGSSQPRDWTCISCTAGGFVTTEPPGSPLWCLKPAPLPLSPYATWKLPYNL